MQYFKTFYSRPEAAVDVISGRFVGLIVLDKYDKLRGPRLNRFREIPPGDVGGGILYRF